MTHYILYKTINLLNNKYYVGVHQTQKLDDGYLGSGTIINRAIKKYGKKSFRRDILETFSNAKTMFNREKEMLSESLLADNQCYNIAPGGNGGSMKQNQKPFAGPHCDETKKAISFALKEWYLTHTNPFLGQKHSDETKERIGKKNTIALAGKKKSPEHKRKISESIAKNTSHFEFTDALGNKKIIVNLKEWCATNNLEYKKVFPYVNTGKIKMIERYRSYTREWFTGCSISRVNGVGSLI